MRLLEDGQTRSIDVSTMRSTAIFEEVMNIGGGERWRRFVEERAAKAGVDNGAELCTQRLCSPILGAYRF